MLFHELREEKAMQTTEDYMKQLTAEVDDRCRELYGNSLPDEVAKRLDDEWKVLEEHRWQIEFQGLMIVKQISHENDCPFIIRSPIESSFIAYLLGLSIVDPLPPHYLCPECKLTEFPKDTSALCGPDLPDKLCPVCGTPMLKSGFDAQMEFLFSRVWPYCEVRVSSMIIDTIRDCLTDLYEEQEPEIDSVFMQLSSKPDGAAMIDLIDQDDYDEESPLLRKLGLIIEDIPPAGTWKLSELIDEIIREMGRNRPIIKEIADAVSPSCFEDFIRIDGLSHVEETWKPLIENNRPLREIITSRDDIFNTLTRHGMDREKAYRIASAVRKGKCFDGKHPKWPEWEKEMQEIGISDWYIQSMKWILYLWPRASCAANVLRAYRTAWVKLHNHGA